MSICSIPLSLQLPNPPSTALPPIHPFVHLTSIHPSIHPSSPSSSLRSPLLLFPFSSLHVYIHSAFFSSHQQPAGAPPPSAALTVCQAYQCLIFTVQFLFLAIFQATSIKKQVLLKLYMHPITYECISLFTIRSEMLEFEKTEIYINMF